MQFVEEVYENMETEILVNMMHSNELHIHINRLFVPLICVVSGCLRRLHHCQWCNLVRHLNLFL